MRELREPRVHAVQAAAGVKYKPRAKRPVVALTRPVNRLPDPRRCG